MVASLLALAALAGSAFAQAAGSLQINTVRRDGRRVALMFAQPTGVAQCEPTLLNYSGGQAPYFISVLRASSL